MTKLVLSNILRFVVLIVLQILLLNYVNFGGYIIPFVYILAVLMLPTRIGNIPLLLIAFAAGAVVDVFCNIPGFHAFCCTLMAFARVLVGDRMLTRDDPDVVIDVPSVRTVPFQPFAMYLLVMSAVYCIAYCLLESVFVTTCSNYLTTQLRTGYSCCRISSSDKQPVSGACCRRKRDHFHIQR